MEKQWRPPTISKTRALVISVNSGLGPDLSGTVALLHSMAIAHGKVLKRKADYKTGHVTLSDECNTTAVMVSKMNFESEL